MHITNHVDGTIPIQALLFPHEQLLATQDGVGIYTGQQKSPEHQSGTIHASSHRLFYIDANKPYKHSFSIDLSSVSQTEYYAGLLRSSAKVTLFLQTAPSPDATTTAGQTEETWECQVCAYKNKPIIGSAARICALCGVPAQKVAAEQQQILSTSLPSSSSSAISTPVSRRQSTIACPTCTFLNHPSMRVCEMCGSDLPVPMRMKSAPATPRPATPDEDGLTSMKISFRKGGDKAFYAVLRRSLQSKAWEEGDQLPLSANGDFRTTGISGILRTVESTSQTRSSNMTDALKDLEAFMIKAKEMVKVAEELNEKLTAMSGTTTTSLPLPTTSSSSSSSGAANELATLVPPSTEEPESATFIRSSLSQLGLQMSNTPITLEMIKDERRWLEELAKELALLLQRQTASFSSSSSQSPSANRDGKRKTMMKNRDIIPLDEIWCAYNRARGISLIPPSTFLQILPLLPLYTDPPLSVRTLPSSGVKVLHTPEFSRREFAGRVGAYLTLGDYDYDQQGGNSPSGGGGWGKTTTEIARIEEINVSLAEELILDVEDEGFIVRDDLRCVIHERAGAGVGGGGAGGPFGEIRWCRNLLVGWVWDGQE